MAVNPNQYRLDEQEHQAIFEQDIKPDLFAGAKPSGQPVAVIFGGQPGAGKSAAVDAALLELGARGGAVQIIGDDLRGFHPKYADLMGKDDKTAAFYTDRDTGLWVEKSIAEAKAQRVNIVIEGTMRDGNKVAETMESLRAAGYQIDARALAVNARLSEQGILQRYENQRADRGAGRMTTPEAHKAAYDGMLHTLDRIDGQTLADRVTIYRRNGEVVYQNELRGGAWVREPHARAAVEAERARPMTEQERKEYAKGFDELAEMLERPERRASTEEVRKIAILQRDATGDASPLSDKAQVAQAVALAFIDSKVKDPAQREALKAAVDVRMAERERVNKVLTVPVYDKAAPAKLQQPEQDQAQVERNGGKEQ